jgi:hypothetical protein
MFAEYAIGEEGIGFTDSVSVPASPALLSIRKGNPCWSREAEIGDVGGDLNKEDSKTEGQEPYAAMVLRELRAMRGSLYSKKFGTYVHAENLARARFYAAVYWRTPEKFRANLTPSRSDERLPYWVNLLAIPVQAGDSKNTIRARAAAHYRAANGPTDPGIRDALTELLGDAFVGVVYTRGTDLDTPPATTYWPGINPGPASHDLGNGTWTSSRATIEVQVQRPSGMTPAAFNNLINVQLFQLLDRMLRATNDFTVTEV